MQLVGELVFTSLAQKLVDSSEEDVPRPEASCRLHMMCFLHTVDNLSLNSHILQLHRDSLFQTGCEGQETAPVSHS